MPDSDTERELALGQEALLANLAAVRAVTSAVEGTFGPTGLDCLLVDEDGEIIITNDGVTILEHLEVDHPAARLMIGAARAQEKTAGDGTTTAAILTGALIAEGANQVLRGVPVVAILEGMRLGVEAALAALAALRLPVAGLADPRLDQVALVAGRGDRGLARAVLAGAGHLPPGRLLAPGFALAEAVRGLEGAVDQAFPGLVIEREPLSSEVPSRLTGVRVLICEGALAPEGLPPEAMTTVPGFERSEANARAFRALLDRIVENGLQVVLAGRGIEDAAAQYLLDRGILALRRVSASDLRRAVSFTGAKLLRHLGECGPDLADCLGHAEVAEVDREFKLVKLAGGAGVAETSIIVGGNTGEVVAERERIARDAAAAVQGALRGGIVPGGGAAELAAARALEELRLDGLRAYGVACVREALGRPMAQLAANAGFNPLEKLALARAAQERTGSPNLGVDPETGAVADLAAHGIWDPWPVKEAALRTAAETARAILRINNILRMRPKAGGEGGWHDPA